MNLRQDLGAGSFSGSHSRKCQQGRGPVSQEKEGHWEEEKLRLGVEGAGNWGGLEGGGGGN